MAVSLVLLTAGAKAWTAATDLRMLEVVDPILSIKNRYVLLGVALVEFACAATLLGLRDRRVKGLILLWLGANFVLYRAALALSGAGAPCPCLGGLVGRLGLTSSAAELMTKGIIAYFTLVGCYLIRPRASLQNRRDENGPGASGSPIGAVRLSS